MPSSYCHSDKVMLHQGFCVVGGFHSFFPLSLNLLRHCLFYLTKVQVNWARFLAPLCKPTTVSLMQVIIVFGTERLAFFLDEDWQFDGCSGRGTDGFEVRGGREGEALQSRQRHETDTHARTHVSQCWQSSLFSNKGTIQYSTNCQDNLFACTQRLSGCSIPQWAPGCVRAPKYRTETASIWSNYCCPLIAFPLFLQ